MANIYGNILKELGLLSNGEVIQKKPSDFLGAAVGVSAQNTKTILSLCEGKVLIIDEAYGLNDGGKNGGGGSYGKQVLDTLTENISGGLGEDRVVILIGYDDQLQVYVND